ncbi:MaoC family dehydratase [Caballeronia sp. GAWG1-5s-s]|uniref:MaoC family dehydratase n=2 Tax=Caballeronia TaxID=1827195 RepID=UPI002029010A
MSERIAPYSRNRPRPIKTTHDMAKRPHMDCYAIGDTADFAKTVSEYDIYGFAGIVGDFYAVHLNEEYAKGTRFERRIAQGCLSVGFLSTVMGHMAQKAPSPGAVSYRYDITFNAPVFIGDTVTARLTLEEKDEERNVCVFAADVTRQDGVVVASGKTYLKVL